MSQTVPHPAPSSQALLSPVYTLSPLPAAGSPEMADLYERYCVHQEAAMEPRGWETEYRSPEVMIWRFCKAEAIPLKSTVEVAAICDAFERADSSGGDDAFQDSVRASCAKADVAKKLEAMVAYASACKLPTAALTAADAVTASLPGHRMEIDGKALSRHLTRLLLYMASLQLGKGTSPIGVGVKEAGGVIGCCHKTGGNMLNEARRLGLVDMTSDYTWEGHGESGNRVREFLVDLERIPAAILSALSNSDALRSLVALRHSASKAIAEIAHPAWVKSLVKRLKARFSKTEGRKTPSVVCDLDKHLRETRGATSGGADSGPKRSRIKDPFSPPPDLDDWTPY